MVYDTVSVRALAWPEPFFARELWSEHWPDSTVVDVVERFPFRSFQYYINAAAASAATSPVSTIRKVMVAAAFGVRDNINMSCLVPSTSSKRTVENQIGYDAAIQNLVTYTPGLAWCDPHQVSMSPKTERERDSIGG
eukprot:sb/3474501/